MQGRRKKWKPHNLSLFFHNAEAVPEEGSGIMYPTHSAIYSMDCTFYICLVYKYIFTIS